MSLAQIENDYRQHIYEIADHLADMPAAKPTERRHLYLDVLALLQALRQVVWLRLSAVVRASARDEYAKLLEHTNFSEDALAKSALSESQLAAIVMQSYLNASGYLNRSLSQIQAAASALRGASSDSVLRRLAGSSSISNSDLRKRLRERLGMTLASNGRTYSYEPGYYLRMVVGSAESTISRRIAELQSNLLDTDLIIVVGPSSQHAACENARNKVFSLSGTHSDAMPVSVLENGGPTYHLGCRHQQIPFDRTAVSDAEFAELIAWNGNLDQSSTV